MSFKTINISWKNYKGEVRISKAGTQDWKLLTTIGVPQRKTLNLKVNSLKAIENHFDVDSDSDSVSQKSEQSGSSHSARDSIIPMKSVPHTEDRIRVVPFDKIQELQKYQLIVSDSTISAVSLLSEHQIEKIKQHFHELDLDGNNRISVEEVKEYYERQAEKSTEALRTKLETLREKKKGDPGLYEALFNRGKQSIIAMKNISLRRALNEFGDEDELNYESFLEMEAELLRYTQNLE
mmetsp:Transcript_11526/g.17071  ORF Transcript_11526/g.17071 Transcript_11526/m.17071 type:complete len:237 (+) Transcript_11526:95-805(+)